VGHVIVEFLIDNGVVVERGYIGMLPERVVRHSSVGPFDQMICAAKILRRRRTMTISECGLSSTLFAEARPSEFPVEWVLRRPKGVSWDLAGSHD